MSTGIPGLLSTAPTLTVHTPSTCTHSDSASQHRGERVRVLRVGVDAGRLCRGPILATARVPRPAVPERSGGTWGQQRHGRVPGPAVPERSVGHGVSRDTGESRGRPCLRGVGGHGVSRDTGESRGRPCLRGVGGHGVSRDTGEPRCRSCLRGVGGTWGQQRHGRVPRPAVPERSGGDKGSAETRASPGAGRA